MVRIGIALALAIGLIAAVWLPGDRGQVLGSYSTSLAGRTRGQHINARRAARALDRVVIEPGRTCSFNRCVGSWSPDRGYVLAPVSYDGELVVDWGGGVCQTSTTLYNAALIAGLEIVERHRHSWVPSYVAPGRDAAVAQYKIDLRLRNPYPWPVELRVDLRGEQLGIRVLGRQKGPMARVEGAARAGIAPAEVIKSDPALHPGQRRVITHGKPGVRATITRTYLTGARTGTRELVSQDAYPPMNRVTAVGR